MNIPTILISNFSPPWYEFQTNVVRVYKDSPVLDILLNIDLTQVIGIGVQ